MNISRRELLTKTLLVEGGLALFALSLGWYFGPSVFARLEWSWAAAGWGALAALPPLFLLIVIDHFPVGPLKQVRDISDLFLRPILKNCRWPDYFLLAALAGFCEELFFRGWMQPFVHEWLAPWSTNLLVGFIFACCHAITPAYFIIAWLISLYLGGLFLWSDNLLVPMVTHGVYDLIALFAVMELHTPAEPPPLAPSQPALLADAELLPAPEVFEDSKQASEPDSASPPPHFPLDPRP
jgi:membrane protease YdiL (CAAX protease family)